MKADEALRKGEIRDIRIEKIVVGGEGLGYCDGVAVFVPMSVPGDLLQIRIISAKKNYARGLITQILTPGPERVPDTGKISFEDWQGCNFAMLRYDAQLKYKKEIVAEVLRKIGKMEEIPVEEVAPSPEIYHYRNKIIEPFSRRKGEIITGFYARHSHEVFEVRENMLNSRLGNKIIRELKRLLNENRLPVYDENFHSGLLRHVMVRTNSAGEAMVLLVLNAARRDLESERILLALKELIPEIRSLYVSLNPERTNVALGKENRLLWGKETLREEIEGISFHISPLSFFQINFGQAKNLYKKA
ncbi:MAG: TRAM domain-containing protein, partial [Fusobacteriaceae bacterium]|nr:TRAM domain-containing protein [Fusobacteriaceae bacterium]